MQQREKLLRERDSFMEEQRKRDEQVMKEHQAEAARKAESRLKEYYRRQKQAARDGADEGFGGSSTDAAKNDLKDFEAGCGALRKAGAAVALGAAKVLTATRPHLPVALRCGLALGRARAACSRSSRRSRRSWSAVCSATGSSGSCRGSSR